MDRAESHAMSDSLPIPVVCAIIHDDHGRVLLAQRPAHKHLGFSLEELVDLIVFGFKSSFLPYRSKVRMLRTVFQELNTLLAEPKTQKLHTALNSEAL